MDLRTLALAALAEPDLEQKLALAGALKAQAATLLIVPARALQAASPLPGRPARPS